MSGATIEDVKKQEPSDNLQGEGDISMEDPKDTVENSENPMPSTQEEEATIKKKYGGIIPKKPPLISKDHERAYFDSADWALGKQGAQKPKGPLEALRPKLQPTPHQQVRSRRSAYAPTDDEDDDGHDHSPSEDQSRDHSPCEDQRSALDDGNSNDTSEDHSRHQ